MTAVLPLVGTVIGAIIALAGTLWAQKRTVGAAAVQRSQDVYRNAAAELVARIEIFLDDGRELWNAVYLKDEERTAEVWPRYLGSWSEFVRAASEGRLVGPPAFRSKATDLRRQVGYFGDVIDSMKRSGKISAEQQSAAEEARTAAEASLKEFEEIARSILEGD